MRANQCHRSSARRRGAGSTDERPGPRTRPRPGRRQRGCAVVAGGRRRHSRRDGDRGSLLLVPTYGGAGAGRRHGAWCVDLGDRHRGGAPASGCLAGWLVPVIALGVVLLGSLLVAPRLRVVGFLPSLIGMGRVLRGTVDGWRELLTVADSDRGGRRPAGAAVDHRVGRRRDRRSARATRRPALALLVPAASADAVRAAWVPGRRSRSRSPSWWPGMVTAGVSWAVWVGTRTRRRTVARAADGNAAGHRGAATRSAESVTRQALAVRRAGISAAVLAVAVLVGAVTAGAATPSRTALREIIELPVDPAAFVSPLSTFRTYTKDQADAVQLSVKRAAGGCAAAAGGPGRLRRAAVHPEQQRGPVRPDRPGAPGTAIGRAGDRQTFGWRTTPGSSCRSRGRSSELDFAGPRTNRRTEDLRYSEAAATGLMPGGWQQGDRYIVTAAVPPQPTAEQLAAARPLAAPFPTTVALPDLLRSAANRYISGARQPGRPRRWRRSAPGWRRTACSATGRRTKGRGRGLSPAGHGLDRLTAMVAGQRPDGRRPGAVRRTDGADGAVGRVAGPGRRRIRAAGRESTGNRCVRRVGCEIRGRDISAWVEVPFEGYGWVAFDPTPAAGKQSAATPTDRTSAERRTVNAEVPPAVPQA